VVVGWMRLRVEISCGYNLGSRSVVHCKCLDRVIVLFNFFWVVNVMLLKEYKLCVARI